MRLPRPPARSRPVMLPTAMAREVEDAFYDMSRFLPQAGVLSTRSRFGRDIMSCIAYSSFSPLCFY
jgi:hypothetical protein